MRDLRAEITQDPEGRWLGVVFDGEAVVHECSEEEAADVGFEIGTWLDQHS